MKFNIAAGIQYTSFGFQLKGLGAQDQCKGIWIYHFQKGRLKRKWLNRIPFSNQFCMFACPVRKSASLSHQFEVGWVQAISASFLVWVEVKKISSGMLKLQHASYESLFDKFLHGPLRLNRWWKNEHVDTPEVLARSDYVRPVTTDTASSFPLQPKPPKLHLADRFSSPGVPDPLNPSLLSGDGWSNIRGCNGAKMKLGCLLNLLITIILHTLSSAQTIIVPAVYLHWNEYILNKFKQTAWVYYAFYIPN